MIKAIDRGFGNVLGFKLSGVISKADYDILVPRVESAVEEHGDIRLFLDVRDLRWEKVDAWGKDLNFGKTYRKRIAKMAFVGDKKWEQHLVALAQPFYAREIESFESDEDAWRWLES